MTEEDQVMLEKKKKKKKKKKKLVDVEKGGDRARVRDGERKHHFDVRRSIRPAV